MAIRKRDGVEAADRKELLDKMNQVSRKVGLGSLIAAQKGVAMAKYDFSVLGGAIGSVNLRDLEDSTKTVVIPDNAVITDAFIDILTPMASSGGNGTIELTVQSAGDLKAAVDADTLSGVVACVPVGTAASAIKLTAERTLVATIATSALTAGKFVLVVEYFVTE